MNYYLVFMDNFLIHRLIVKKKCFRFLYKAKEQISCKKYKRQKTCAWANMSSDRRKVRIN